MYNSVSCKFIILFKTMQLLSSLYENEQFRRFFTRAYVYPFMAANFMIKKTLHVYENKHVFVSFHVLSAFQNKKHFVCYLKPSNDATF